MEEVLSIGYVVLSFFSYACLFSAFKTNWHWDGAAIDALEKKLGKLIVGKLVRPQGQQE